MLQTEFLLSKRLGIRFRSRRTRKLTLPHICHHLLAYRWHSAAPDPYGAVPLIPVRHPSARVNASRPFHLRDLYIYFIPPTSGSPRLHFVRRDLLESR